MSRFRISTCFRGVFASCAIFAFVFWSVIHFTSEHLTKGLLLMVAFLSYLSIYIGIRARLDYRATWLDTIYASLLATFLNVVALLGSIPAGFAVVSMAEPIVHGSLLLGIVWFFATFFISGMIHGCALNVSDRKVFAERSPNSSTLVSAITVGFFSFMLCSIVIWFDRFDRETLLVSLGVLSIFPHLSLVPSVDLDDARP